MGVVDFFKGIKEIPNKGKGGCLFFCYCFYLWLEKNNMPNGTFRIKQYSKYGDDVIISNLTYLKNDEGMPKPDQHFTWFYEGVEYDASGIYLGDGFQYCRILPINDYRAFCYSALVNGGWNLTFDRNEAIEVMEHVFGLDLFDVRY